MQQISKYLSFTENLCYSGEALSEAHSLMAPNKIHQTVQEGIHYPNLVKGNELIFHLDVNSSEKNKH